MEIYISISSIKEEDKEVQIKEEEEEKRNINLGRGQIFIDISNTENSLIGIKILLPTPVSEETFNVVRKTAKENSEIKIS
jgi:hypothetical protein